MERARTRATPCTRQPPTRGDATVLVAKVVLPFICVQTSD